MNGLPFNTAQASFAVLFFFLCVCVKQNRSTGKTVHAPWADPSTIHLKNERITKEGERLKEKKDWGEVRRHQRDEKLTSLRPPFMRVRC
jgi:hypothetical protein